MQLAKYCFANQGKVKTSVMVTQDWLGLFVTWLRHSLSTVFLEGLSKTVTTHAVCQLPVSCLFPEMTTAKTSYLCIHVFIWWQTLSKSSQHTPVAASSPWRNCRSLRYSDKWSV